MKKFLIFVIVVAALAYGAYTYLKPGQQASIRATFQSPAGFFKTTLRVIRGSVNLFNLDKSGKPVLQRVVNEGEQVVVFSKPTTPADAIRMASPTALSIFYQELEKKADKMPEGRFTRAFTEEEFMRVIAPELSEKASLTGVELKIGPSGFRGSAVYHAGALAVPLTAKGRVSVDKTHDDALYLYLSEVGIGTDKPGRDVLNGVELEFQLDMQKVPSTVKILDIEYSGGAALVTLEKKQLPPEEPFAERMGKE